MNPTAVLLNDAICLVNFSDELPILIDAFGSPVVYLRMAWFMMFVEMGEDGAVVVLKNTVYLNILSVGFTDSR